MASEKAIEKIKALLANAAKLADFKETFDEKFSSDSSCDKKGYGFGRDSRFVALSIETTFDSWAGYFGSSSCHTILRVDRDLVQPFLIDALNKHWELIFATAADLMRQEASALTEAARKELKEITDLLAKAESLNV